MLRQSSEATVISRIPGTPFIEAFFKTFHDHFRLDALGHEIDPFPNHVFNDAAQLLPFCQWERIDMLTFPLLVPQLANSDDDNPMQRPVDCRQAEWGNTGRLNLGIKPLVVTAESLVVTAIPWLALSIAT